VFDSPDLGFTWGETGQGTSAFQILSLCDISNQVYAGTDNGILHYTDSLGVKYWIPANGGIINSSVLSMTSYQNYLFATTGDQHVYMTKNGGKTWGDITENLIDSVTSIIIDSYHIYAATNGSGLWSRSLGDFTGIDNTSQSPSVSVYPNPAKDRIRINLRKTGSGTFNVEIINMHGQVVSTGSFPFQTRNQAVQMDCSELPSGLYSIRIISGHSSIVKKIVIQ
jgi:hypothetical protein